MDLLSELHALIGMQIGDSIEGARLVDASVELGLRRLQEQRATELAIAPAQRGVAIWSGELPG